MGILLNSGFTTYTRSIMLSLFIAYNTPYVLSGCGLSCTWMNNSCAVARKVKSEITPSAGADNGTTTIDSAGINSAVVIWTIAFAKYSPNSSVEVGTTDAAASISRNKSSETITGTVDRPLELGAMIRFPTTDQFIMAKRDLVTAIVSGRSIAPVVAETSPEKRQCVRPQVEVGEAADDTGVAVREKELSFLLRAKDLERREYAVTTDMALQTEVYRRLLCEHGDTQAEDRICSFLSCGLISRVQRVQVFLKTEKLKLILMGCVLLEDRKSVV